MKERYLQSEIFEDMKEKMVFLGGPRQVGKTTLAKAIAEKSFPNANYFNWDNEKHKRAILQEEFDTEAKLLIFDEIHKYGRWKNYIKGIYDVHKARYQILVTGSARLDLYKKGGDSLLGRYHYHRLHPFSIAELGEERKKQTPGKELSFSYSSHQRETYESLLQFGGFPEPFIKQNTKTLRRWQRQRIDTIIKEDIRDIEILKNLSLLELLVLLLPERIGSVLSLNSLREDLRISHNTVSHWMDILERFYYLFRIPPFFSTHVKSVRKEPKMYLWDWSEVPNPATRLENMVASHLLKFVHFFQDTEGYKVELFYLRDHYGREVDFLVTFNRKPWFAIEVKSQEQTVSKHLKYFGERLKIPFLFQIIEIQGKDIWKNGVRLISVEKFLGGLV